MRRAGRRAVASNMLEPRSATRSPLATATLLLLVVVGVANPKRHGFLHHARRVDRWRRRRTLAKLLTRCNFYTPLHRFRGYPTGAPRSTVTITVTPPTRRNL